jgi:geranylgeranylglycerol-phosphate geranylgeranyltransferase
MVAQALKGAVRMTRPLNVLLLFMGVMVGGTLAAGRDAFLWPQNRILLLAAVVACLIGAGANIINDILDADIDRVNRPARPIPAGEVPVPLAWALCGIAWMGGFGIALYLSYAHAGIAFGAAVMLFLYNVRLKRVVLLGNLTVATIVGVAVIYGGLSMGSAGDAAVGSVFAFLTTVAREVMKDAQDRTGDLRQGIRTFPILYGDSAAVILCSTVLLLTVALTPIPYLAFDYSRLYLLLVMLVDGLLLASIWALDADRLEHASGRASVLLKSGMAAGMFALAAAKMGAPYVLVL